MSDDPPKIDSVTRKEASSGRLSYGTPEILRDSKKYQVVLVPFYIPRSSGTDLSVKIITYRKQPPPNVWTVVEEKAVSLDEAAARKLLAALKKHLAVSDQASDGEYIVIRADQGTADYGQLDPSAVATALARVLSRPDIVQHLATTEFSDELVLAFRGAIRLREMKSAVASLRQNLAEGENNELIYQTWCKKHSWAFGNAYVLTDDVRELTPSDQVDLLMPSVITGFRDIVELKRPDAQVLYYDQPRRSHYFGAEVSKAIGQVHRYLDILHEVGAKGIRDHPEIVAYHPRAIIVIGRSHSWQEGERRALQGLNSRLNGITVMTYDQLLAQGERLVELLSVEQAELFDVPDPELGQLDDDFPF
jgi:hypothetical protein